MEGEKEEVEFFKVVRSVCWSRLGFGGGVRVKKRFWFF